MPANLQPATATPVVLARTASLSWSSVSLSQSWPPLSGASGSWEGCISEQLIDCAPLSGPKLAMVATRTSAYPPQPFLFRSYELPPEAEPLAARLAAAAGSSRYAMWQGVRASSAAPYYLDEFALGEERWQDGAVTANNPAALALQQARLLWPHLPVDCLVSIGCGVAPSSHRDRGMSFHLDLGAVLVECACNTERVHEALATTLDLVPSLAYYRFQPMDDRFAVELDDVSQGTLGKLQAAADEFCVVHAVRLDELAALLQRRGSEDIGENIELPENKAEAEGGAEGGGLGPHPGGPRLGKRRGVLVVGCADPLASAGWPLNLSVQVANAVVSMQPGVMHFADLGRLCVAAAEGPVHAHGPHGLHGAHGSGSTLGTQFSFHSAGLPGHGSPRHPQPPPQHSSRQPAPLISLSGSNAAVSAPTAVAPSVISSVGGSGPPALGSVGTRVPSDQPPSSPGVLPAPPAEVQLHPPPSPGSSGSLSTALPPSAASGPPKPADPSAIPPSATAPSTAPSSWVDYFMPKWGATGSPHTSSSGAITGGGVERVGSGTGAGVELTGGIGAGGVGAGKPSPSPTPTASTSVTPRGTSAPPPLPPPQTSLGGSAFHPYPPSSTGGSHKFSLSMGVKSLTSPSAPIPVQGPTQAAAHPPSWPLPSTSPSALSPTHSLFPGSPESGSIHALTSPDAVISPPNAAPPPQTLLGPALFFRNRSSIETSRPGLPHPPSALLAPPPFSQPSPATSPHHRQLSGTFPPPFSPPPPTSPLPAGIYQLASQLQAPPIPLLAQPLGPNGTPLFSGPSLAIDSYNQQPTAYAKQATAHPSLSIDIPSSTILSPPGGQAPPSLSYQRSESSLHWTSPHVPGFASPAAPSLGSPHKKHTPASHTHTSSTPHTPRKPLIASTEVPSGSAVEWGVQGGGHTGGGGHAAAHIVQGLLQDLSPLLGLVHLALEVLPGRAGPPPQPHSIPHGLPHGPPHGLPHGPAQGPSHGPPHRPGSTPEPHAVLAGGWQGSNGAGCLTAQWTTELLAVVEPGTAASRLLAQLQAEAPDSFEGLPGAGGAEHAACPSLSLAQRVAVRPQFWADGARWACISHQALATPLGVQASNLLFAVARPCQWLGPEEVAAAAAEWAGLIVSSAEVLPHPLLEAFLKAGVQAVICLAHPPTAEQALGLPEAFQKVAERLVAGEQLLAIMEQIEQQEPAFNGLICIYVL